ncbi:cysteine hydrolase family protein [Microbispora corallina]|uniref:Isochorismatase n=1 Tax=Microbispora corallina TaxID=83302 RepID=A0ABQ4FZP7_9ACTN|nr:cysteine hydrolase family protein [Microbispora corallina]GIH40298.1 isochorismatase [Microbispora corallina]
MNRALIVIDVQNEYFTGSLPIAHPPREESLAAILRAMDAAGRNGVPVVVVRHTAPESSPLFARGSHGWELRGEVAGRRYRHLVDKAKASAFHETGLRDLLAGLGVDTLAVAGYMTQNCDESTARDAFHLGFAVEFLSDATGTVPLANAAGSRTAEEVHESVLVVMQSNFAAVTTTDRWIEAVEARLPIPRPSIWESTAVARDTPAT